MPMPSVVNILYVSKLCSENVIDYIFRTSLKKPHQQAQKFHRLLAEGLAAQSRDCTIDTLSLIPVTSAIHKKIFWNLPLEKKENILFNYIPMVNLPVIKDLTVFIYTFFKVIRWNFSRRRSDRVAVCDALNLTIAAATKLACKIMGTKVTAIVTDLPHLMVNNSQATSLKYELYKKLNLVMLTNYDKYIILTAPMDAVVNPQRRPSMIMEGLVDVNMTKVLRAVKDKHSDRILIYAGGINERYGIKSLLEAFMMVKGENLRLHIYGLGEMEADMPSYMQRDQRIIYMGIVPNKEVVDAQLRASLLINPRPTNEEFVKYSFPSKNLEYLVSGTPMVTTKLPGMPAEYYPFVYLFDDESVLGMAKTLTTLCSKTDEELLDLGRQAKQFALQNKSNIVQARRVLNFLQSANDSDLTGMNTADVPGNIGVISEK